MKEKILVVEDDKFIADFISDRLKSEKYDTFVAHNGEEGLEILSRELLDLIVTDIVMPKMDGYTFCRKLKEDESTSDIPVVVISAYVERANELKEMGYENILEKPFESQVLIDTVDNILDMAGKRSINKKIFLHGEITPVIQMAIKQFNDLGYKVELKAMKGSFDSIIKDALRFRPDIIILDASSNDVPVKQLIKALKSYVVMKDMTLLFFTSSTCDKVQKGTKKEKDLIEKIKEDCMEVGADEYVQILDRESILSALFKYCKGA